MKLHCSGVAPGQGGSEFETNHTADNPRQVPVHLYGQVHQAHLEASDAKTSRKTIATIQEETIATFALTLAFRGYIILEGSIGEMCFVFQETRGCWPAGGPRKFSRSRLETRQGVVCRRK